MAEPTTPARRNVFAFGVTSLLNDISSEMAYWILPAFLASLGAGPMRLGIIEGIAESMAASAMLLSGWLADRSPRRKPLIVSGYAIANLAKPLLAIVGSWWQVLLVRFADRSAKGIRGAARDVMLSESARQGRMGSAFGFVQAMDSAGAVLGPLLALAILSHGSYRDVFLWSALPGAVCVLVVMMLVRESPRQKAAGGSAAPTSAASDSAKSQDNKSAGTATRIPASFWFMLAVVTLFSLANSSDMFLILRAHDVGIPTRYAPLLGLIFNVVYTAASWPAGRLSDRVPKHLVAAAGYLIFAGTYYIFAKAPSAAAIWWMMAFYGLYYALTNPVLRALVVEVVEPDMRGRAIGTFYFTTSIATLLASLLAGWLWKHHGAPTPFYFSSAVAVLCAVLLLLYRLPTPGGSSALRG